MSKKKSKGQWNHYKTLDTLKDGTKFFFVMRKGKLYRKKVGE